MKVFELYKADHIQYFTISLRLLICVSPMKGSSIEIWVLNGKCKNLRTTIFQALQHFSMRTIKRTTV